MYPELFHFQLPGFMWKLFHIKHVTVYTYAFCIALGCLIAAIYTKRAARKDLQIQDLSNNFFYLIFIFGFIGGKLFYYLEKPLFYFNNPSLLLDNFSGGYVFYGSFITIIPMIIYYLNKKNIAVLPMLDILAITTLIVHAFGRFGCFCGGCCFGLPTNSWVGIIFPSSNHVAVHPSQLYEFFVLLLILSVLVIVKSNKKFHGQIFFLYLGLYAISKIFLEFFRGDARGFIINNVLSHSQFIAFCLLLTAVLFYIKFKNHKLLVINTIKNEK